MPKILFFVLKMCLLAILFRIKTEDKFTFALILGILSQYL